MIPRVKILLVTHLQSWGCRGHSWGLVWTQDHYSWPHFWNHEDIFTLGWVIKFPKKGLGFGPKSAKKAHCATLTFTHPKMILKNIYLFQLYTSYINCFLWKIKHANFFSHTFSISLWYEWNYKYSVTQHHRTTVIRINDWPD